jgi:hypothetical protein
MIIRVLGALLILTALVAAGFEVAHWISAGSYKPVTPGGVWYAVHRASLNTAQAAVQRHLAPWLWDPAIMWLLVQPAWAVAGVPGGLLLWLGRRRKRRRPRRKDR